MALVDYGVVIKRNGKIINTDNDLTMKEVLGFEINKDITCKIYEDEYDFNPAEDYVGWAGDENCFIGFARCTAQLFIRRNEDYECKFIARNGKDLLYVDNYLDEKNKSYSYSWRHLGSNEDRKILTLHTPDAKWEVLYGYAIDPDYNVQLDCAFEYGISTDEIESIAKFHGHILYVNGIKCKFNRKDNCLKRKYTYKELKGHYAIGVLYEDNDLGCRMAKEWYYTSKELPQLMEDLNNLPSKIKIFIAAVGMTEPVVELYATYYHKIVNTDKIYVYNGTSHTDTRIYYREYTRNEINNWRN